MPIAWEDYNLPSFILGSARNQPVPFVAEVPLVGTSYIRPCSETVASLPVTWDVNLVLDNQQALDFNQFLDDYYTQESLLFTKIMNLEVGKNTHTLTIVGPRPQATSSDRGVWAYQFTLYSGILDLTVTPVPPPAVIPPYPVPGVPPGLFVYMPPIGLNTGGDVGVPDGRFSVCASANDQQKVIVATLDGYHAVTTDGGQSWVGLTRFLDSGASPDAQCTALAMSDNGMKIFAGYSMGYSSISNDGGASFTANTQGLGVTDGDFFKIQCASMSGDGNTVIAVFANGHAALSISGGLGFFELPFVFGGGGIGLSFKSAISKDGNNIIVVCTGGSIAGYSFYSTDRGMNWTGSINFLGTSLPVTGTITDVAMSSNGKVAMVTYSGGLSAISTDSLATWRSFTVSEEFIPGATLPASSISIGPNGNDIIVSIINGPEALIGESSDYGATWGLLQSIDMGAAEGSPTSIVDSCVTSTLWILLFTDQGWISSSTYIPPEPTYPVGRAPTTWVQAAPRYLNSGQTGGGAAYAAMSADGEKIMYAATAGAGSMSIDNGLNWTVISEIGFGITSTAAQNARSIAMSDDGQRIIIGCLSGYVGRTIDGGATWEELPRGIGMTTVTSDIRTVSMSDDGLIVFAGNGTTSGNGVISYNGGNTWATVAGLASSLVNASAMSKDGQIIFVSHASGLCRISYDAGASFLPLTTGLAGSTATIVSADMSADGQTIVAVKTDGQGVISYDAGATWALMTPTFLNTGATSFATAAFVQISYDGNVILVTASNHFAAYSANAGVTWNTLPQGLSSGTTGQVSSIATNGDTWMSVSLSGYAGISRA